MRNLGGPPSGAHAVGPGIAQPLWFWGAVTWAVTLAEHALLIAWKGWAIEGASNVLVAWVVLVGLSGIGLVTAPPRPVRAWRGFGWPAVAALDVAMAVALFWFGHGLLGISWLAWLIGGALYGERCRAMCEGRVHA